MRPLTLAEAKARFLHRFTAEHAPAWAAKPCAGNGLYYAPHFATDAEWYANTLFHGECGHVGHRDYCHTAKQTWPHGQWLGAAFVVGQTPVKPSHAAYLQHGKGAGPFLTESVPVKQSPLWWQERGLSYTASGYGSRIPTPFMVRVNNRWRRVYCAIFSNVGTLYIGAGENKITVQIDEV